MKMCFLSSWFAHYLTNMMTRLIALNWPCRLQWSPVAGMLQPKQPEQQWQSSRRGRPSRGPGAARGQLVHLLRAAPPGSCGCALFHGRESLLRWQNFQNWMHHLTKPLSSYICYIVCVLCFILFTHFSAAPNSTDLAR